MKGPDWGLAGAGTTVKKAAMRRMRFYPSHFRTVETLILETRDLENEISHTKRNLRSSSLEIQDLRLKIWTAFQPRDLRAEIWRFAA